MELAQQVFGRGEEFVRKITGKVDRPLQRIREFRNRPNPAVAVTVDMLTTGVDVPDLEFLVFLRPVKSRILFEQMLGRGTRLSNDLPDKSHFTVFDCFDGTLLQYFRDATGITAEPPEQESRTIREVIQAIWDNRDREYNVRCLVKRLQRIDKEMSGEARERFSAFVPDGDLAEYARKLPARLREQLTATMGLLRDPRFQELLVNYKRPDRAFYVAAGVEDTVSSERLLREGGVDYKPEDYLAAFALWVQAHQAHVEAIRILLDRPSDWSTDAIRELRDALKSAPEHFTEDRLRTVHKDRYDRALVDIISMVKHAANEASPLLTAEERVEAALACLTTERVFTETQRGWLDRIRRSMVDNLSIGRSDFEDVPILANAGGWGRANRDFGGGLPEVLRLLNEAVAA